MLQTIKNWLLKPYPFPATLKAKVLTSLVFGKFIFLFLLIFKPFNFGKLEENMLYFAFMYGLITLFVVASNLFFLPFIFPKYFNPNKWKIGKMLLLVLGIVILIGVANWYFSQEMFPENIERYSLAYFTFITGITGIFPLGIYVYFSEKIGTKKHQVVVKKIAEVTKSTPKENLSNFTNTITIVGDTKKEVFELPVDKLVYISYEKNYASLFYLKESKIVEQVMRTTLNKLEKQFTAYNFIVRCHKSYLVNTHHVKEIQGNARSYLLKIPNTTANEEDFLIPVSRNFPKELLFTLVM